MKYFLNGGGNELGCLMSPEMQQWFEGCGITNLLVIPFAINETYWQKLWENPQIMLRLKNIKVTSITMTNYASETVSKVVKSADAVYFPGGSPGTLLRRLTLETDLITQLKSQDHFKAMGGGSAGEMAMGEKTFLGSSEQTELAEGLNFVPKVILDSHFSKHNRQARLQSMLLKYPGFTGIGIDDNTTLILNKNFQPETVLGNGTVTIYKEQSESIYDSNSTFS